MNQRTHYLEERRRVAYDALMAIGVAYDDIACCEVTGLPARAGRAVMKMTARGMTRDQIVEALQDPDFIRNNTFGIGKVLFDWLGTALDTEPPNPFDATLRGVSTNAARIMGYRSAKVSSAFCPFHPVKEAALVAAWHEGWAHWEGR